MKYRKAREEKKEEVSLWCLFVFTVIMTIIMGTINENYLLTALACFYLPRAVYKLISTIKKEIKEYF